MLQLKCSCFFSRAKLDLDTTHQNKIEAMEEKLHSVTDNKVGYG
jgi:hypothetical protein